MEHWAKMIKTYDGAFCEKPLTIFTNSSITDI